MVRSKMIKGSVSVIVVSELDVGRGGNRWVAESVCPAIRDAL